MRVECVEITADPPRVEASRDAAIGFLSVGRRHTLEWKVLGAFQPRLFPGEVLNLTHAPFPLTRLSQSS